MSAGLRLKTMGNHRRSGSNKAGLKESKPKPAAKPRAPNAPGTGIQPSLSGPDTSAPPPPQQRPSTSPDRTALEMAMRNRTGKQGGNRGSVLSAVYGLPEDGTRAIRSLQSFNGPRNGRTVLGQ
jgi:hypothetical protein